MPIARPLLKYDRLKTRITTPGGDLPARRITDPTPITLSVGCLPFLVTQCISVSRVQTDSQIKHFVLHVFLTNCFYSLY